jgi:serine/threonine protein kinase
MAPEQIQGKSRPASDQYSLAIITYEWLTGHCPYQGSFAEVASQHMFAPFPPFQMKYPAIPSDVEQVLKMALAKNPEARFAQIEAFAIALEQASQPGLSTLPMATTT